MKKYLLLLLAASSLTQAATFNVSTTAELRTALSTAATNGEDDTIILADGTYKTTDDDEGTFVYLSNEIYSITLQGSNADNVILDGNGQHRIFNHTSIKDSLLALEKISFINGSNVETYDNYAGGVYTDYDVEVKYCKFINNIGSGSGGGLSTLGYATVSDSSFTNNTVILNGWDHAKGGGLYAVQGAYISNSDFISNNVASISVELDGMRRGGRGSEYSGSGGGGFYTDAIQDVYVINSNFKDNVSYGWGGGINLRGQNRTLTVEGSLFERNVANRAAGLNSHFSATSINNSEFIDNSSYLEGGGFSATSPIIKNSTFKNNTVTNIGGLGGAFIAKSVSVQNSIFQSNHATIGGAGYASRNTGDNISVVNSLFIDNSSALHIIGEPSKIINNIFINNEVDLTGDDSSIFTLSNNYINEDKLEVLYFSSNNIFDGVILDFVDDVNGDFRLTFTSGLIDAGTIELDDVSLPDTDFDGNIRVSGGVIDIGPYEFSTTRPTINSVTYTGTAKEQNEISFTTDYTLADGREVTEVSYDFMNDGNYTAVNTYTYNTAGTYTVGVKVTDSEGEFSTTSTTVTVAVLPFSEMTYEQKLIKAISPEYYDLLLSEIDIEKTESFSSGKQYVQDNLSEFSLVTEDTLATAVAAATTTGITDGENNVINDPVGYGLNIVVGLSKESIAQLPTGWKMISIPEDVTDLSIFDDAKIVWFFNNETQAWSGYSSNSNAVQQMKDKNIGIITSLSAGDGIFIEM